MGEFEQTAEKGARVLRATAEMTAKMSQNWENYEGICKSILMQALQHHAPPEDQG